MEPEAPADQPEGASGATWAIAAGALLAGVAGGIAFPILPAVGLKVGLPIAFIGVILAANRATRVFANPIVGFIADRFGGRRTLLTGLVIQIVVMFFYWLGVKTSHAGIFFLLGRILHGPGSSSVFVAGQALALHAGGRTRGGKSGGIVRGGMAVGVPFGLVLGGLLAEKWGDAATFETAAFALVLATIAAYAFVPDLRVPIKTREPFFASVRALGDKRLAAIGGLNFAATFAASGMVLTTTTLLVHERHLVALGMQERGTASIFMGLLVLSEGLSMPVLGVIGDRRDAHAWIATIGMTCMIPALLVIAFAAHGRSFAFGLAALGVSVGALGPSVLALINKTVSPENRGLAVGAMQVCADIGGATGPLVGTAFFAGAVALPYEVSAGVIALFVPAAFWLTRAKKAPS